MPPKSAKSKKSTIAPPPPEPEVVENIELKLTITQIGNFNELLPYNQGYVFDAVCFCEDIPKEEIRNQIFYPCESKVTHKVHYEWIFRPRNFSAETVWEMASKPLLLKVTGVEEGEGETIRKDIGYLAIDLGDIFIDDVKELKKTERLTEVRVDDIYCVPNMKTWPKKPFVTYSLSVGDYKFKEVQDFRKLSISFDCVIHPPKDWLPGEFDSYLAEVGLTIPVQENGFKFLKIKNGTFTELRNVNKLKSCYNNTFLPLEFHDTKIPTEPRITAESLKIPRDFKIAETFADQTVLSFQVVFQTKIPRNAFKYIVERRKMTLELLLVPENPSLEQSILHFLGVVPIDEFAKDDVKSLKYGVALFKFHPQLYQSFPTPETPIFKSPNTWEAKPKPSTPTKKGKKRTSVKATQIVVPEYLIDEDGNNVCMIVQVDIDQPLVEGAKVDTKQLEEEELQRQNLLKNQCKKLEANFSTVLVDFIKAYNEKYAQVAHLVQNSNLVSFDDIRIGREKCLLEAGINMVTHGKDMSSNDSFKKEVYVYVVTRIHDILNYTDENRKDLRRFRIQCGMELFELGFESEARDFFVLNIMDCTGNPTAYIDYAIYNLFAMDIGKANECCKKALAIDANAHMAILLHAYIAFMNRDYDRAESLLIPLTKKENSFAEAWMALYLTCYQQNKLFLLKFAEEGLVAANENPLVTIHHDQDELLWTPRPSDDPKLKALFKFIQWGCIGFAEFGLGMIIHQYGCDSFEFTYHMALVYYHKRDYQGTMRRLRQMNRFWASQECCRLKAHCLLNEGSDRASDVAKDNCCGTVVHDKQYNLILLKLGKFYMDCKKYRTARFYLKKAFRKYKTFAALKMLACVAYKCQNHNVSEMCCKMMYELNPFNKISFPGLVQVYASKKLLPQHDYCANKSENTQKA